MFTVKSLFKNITLTEELLNKHRGYFGSHLRDVYKQKTGVIPEKILDNDMHVNSYPDSFRLDAEDLLSWYEKQFILGPKKIKPPLQLEQPIVQGRKKRMRIVHRAFATDKLNLNNK